MDWPGRCMHDNVGITSHGIKQSVYQTKIVGLEHPVDCTTIDNQVLADDGIRVIAAEQRAKCPEIVRIRQSLRRHAEEFDAPLLLYLVAAPISLCPIGQHLRQTWRRMKPGEEVVQDDVVLCKPLG